MELLKETRLAIIPEHEDLQADYVRGMYIYDRKKNKEHQLAQRHQLRINGNKIRWATGEICSILIGDTTTTETSLKKLWKSMQKHWMNTVIYFPFGSSDINEMLTFSGQEGYTARRWHDEEVPNRTRGGDSSGCPIGSSTQLRSTLYLCTLDGLDVKPGPRHHLEVDRRYTTRTQAYL